MNTTLTLVDLGGAIALLIWGVHMQRRRDRNFSNHGNRRWGTSDMRKIGVLRTLRT